MSGHRLIVQRYELLDVNSEMPASHYLYQMVTPRGVTAARADPHTCNGRVLITKPGSANRIVIDRMRLLERKCSRWTSEVIIPLKEIEVRVGEYPLHVTWNICTGGTKPDRWILEYWAIM